MGHVTRIVEGQRMGVSRNAVPPAETVRLRRQDTLQQSPLTRNLAQSTKWVRLSRSARALREQKTVGEGRPIRRERGGTKGGSLIHNERAANSTPRRDMLTPVGRRALS